MIELVLLLLLKCCTGSLVFIDSMQPLNIILDTKPELRIFEQHRAMQHEIGATSLKINCKYVSRPFHPNHFLRLQSLCLLNLLFKYHCLAAELTQETMHQINMLPAVRTTIQKLRAGERSVEESFASARAILFKMTNRLACMVCDLADQAPEHSHIAMICRQEPWKVKLATHHRPIMFLPFNQ